MVTLEEVRASNAQVSESLSPGLVTVFVGGTRGVGESTMKGFARHVAQPRIYFVGRSERAAARVTADLAAINPRAECHFIRVDVSLLRNVDKVCWDIKRRERFVNLLFFATGVPTVGKGQYSETAESLYYPTAMAYYSRVRFIVNLLPLLQRAPALRRVVSVYGGGCEGQLCLGDLQGRSLPTVLSSTTSTPLGLDLRSHTSSMMTLAFESLALEAPDSHSGRPRSHGIIVIIVCLGLSQGPAAPCGG
ncbi:hypothetical protein VTJ49DRAFT_7427 [Mycothermus thermophilus]|uniref:Uncharacterized protein n=1 Tax=Humicola insolens TaxID=85995 RepID=A0ABR3VJJ8_HUMIN